MAKKPEQTGQFRKLSAPDAVSGAEGPSTAAPIRILLVEDGVEDAELLCTTYKSTASTS